MLFVQLDHNFNLAAESIFILFRIMKLKYYKKKI